MFLSPSIYIYIYIYRERERDIYIPKKLEFAVNGQFVLVYIYIENCFFYYIKHMKIPKLKFFFRYVDNSVVEDETRTNCQMSIGARPLTNKETVF